PSCPVESPGGGCDREPALVKRWLAAGWTSCLAGRRSPEILRGMVMDLMPLDQLGAREVTPGTIQFGVFLPWVSSQDGNRLFVKVIHENDQFLQAVPPLAFELAHTVDPVYGDYWSRQVTLGQ